MTQITNYYVCSNCGGINYDSFSTAMGLPRAFCRDCMELVMLTVAKESFGNSEEVEEE